MTTPDTALGLLHEAAPYLRAHADAIEVLVGDAGELGLSVALLRVRELSHRVDTFLSIEEEHPDHHDAPIPRPCPRCSGSGVIAYYSTPEIADDVICPTCHGSGLAEPDEETP